MSVLKCKLRFTKNLGLGFGSSKIMFYLCKLKQKGAIGPVFTRKKEMKNRIRQIMESKHMTQQVFAQFIGMSPASLSSIYNGRTNPTLNIVEAIKKKIPDINTDWLMFGSGSMYVSSGVSDAAMSPDVPSPEGNLFGGTPMTLDFEPVANTIPTPTPQPAAAVVNSNSVKNTRSIPPREEVKVIDKPQRRVVEIRVFYDDQTWESFSPSKK